MRARRSASVLAPPAPAPTSGLQARVEHRKRELISEIVEHKKNSSRYGAADEVLKIKGRLDELSHILQDALVNGWGNVTPHAKVRLDDWMSK